MRRKSDLERLIEQIKEDIKEEILFELRDSEKRSFHVEYDVVDENDFIHIKNLSFVDSYMTEFTSEKIKRKSDVINADTANAAEQKIINKYRDTNLLVFNLKTKEIGVNLYE